jgi:hypothetical protein
MFNNFTPEDIRWLKGVHHGHYFNKLIEGSKHQKNDGYIAESAWWYMWRELTAGNHLKDKIIKRAVLRYGKDAGMTQNEIDSVFEATRDESGNVWPPSVANEMYPS